MCSYIAFSYYCALLSLFIFNQHNTRPQFVSSGALFFFSFAWTSLKRGLPKERNESDEKEKKVKEEEEEEGHFNAGLVLDETADQVSKLMHISISCFMSTDQVSKLSGDIHGDSRGT